MARLLPGFSIRFRLLMGMGFLGALLLSMVAVTWFTLDYVRSNTQSVINTYEPQVDRMTRVELLMVKISLEARHAILSANEPLELHAASNRIRSDRQALVDLLHVTEAHLSTDVGRDIMKKIKETDATFWHLSQTVTRYAQEGNVAAAYSLLTKDLVPARNRQLEYIAEQKEWQRQLMNRALADADQTIARVKWVLALVVMSVLLILGYLLLRLIRSITNPLSSLLNTIVEVEHSGDYKKRVNAHGHDEVARTAAAFDRMMDIIETRTSELARSHEQLEDKVAQRTQELSQAVIAAKTANEAKSRFLATMSHELRTPMNGVLGMAQLLLAEQVDTQKTKAYASTILNSGQTLLTLLNDILDLSKIESGTQTLEISKVSPYELLRNTESLFLSNAQSKGIQLHTRWRGMPDEKYRGDRNRLQQILSNLVNNAIKFTSNGAVYIEAIEISRSFDMAWLEFSVHDSGMGIPKNKQALLFRPFSQIDNSSTREFSGTGLGLSIVKTLVHLMGGEVGVESDEGKGARFWFKVRLPIVPTSMNADTQPQALSDNEILALPSETSAGHRCVLVVEDNKINQEVIAAMLAKLGIDALLADNGQIALEMLQRQSHPVTAVMMDVQMPVLDGYQATRLIRMWEKENGRRPLPIIAVTADAFPEDRERCREVGMNDFLPKPIKSDALTKMLAKWPPTLALGD